ncbi:MAG: histidinol dehydrogenase [Verrucomicrobiae bacterium]|nr:histidinol dehydrogenase [Verrucomicrobiae bacterium]
MKLIRQTDPQFDEHVRELVAQSSMFDPVIEARAREIIDAVRARGDAALIEFTEQFDGVRLRPDQLAVTKPELVTACIKADRALRDAVADAARNIAAYARRSLRKDWEMKNAHGAVVGEKFDPYQRVGIYVPGGTAPLVSTALMTVLLAKVAGCPEIVVCTPCSKDGTINPALLFAIRTSGATEVYRIGGAQAIAAMAYGTETIRPVQKIFGPGNAYVVAAKRLVFGKVAVDLLPGPSELLVIADDTAHPKYVAADMLAQAEHGSGSERIWLVTTSARLISAVRLQLMQQLQKLSRKEFIQRVLDSNTWLIHVRTIGDAVKLANEIAPEHCQVVARNAQAVARQLRTAGAVFIGPWSPTVLGDYVAGPSHTLPTGGAGAAFGGLSVDQFQRRTSIIQYSRAALRRALPTVQKFAELEGLHAHGISAQIRCLGPKKQVRAGRT